MSKSYLSSAELDALPPATDEQIDSLRAWAINRLVENDIDDREWILPSVIVPLLAVLVRLDAAEGE